jgi:hypothetical protein
MRLTAAPAAGVFQMTAAAAASVTGVAFRCAK